MTADEKFAAKRANEGTKALGALLNNLAVGTVVAGFLSPWASGHPEPWWAAIGLLLLSIGLHLVSQTVLRRLLKPEERDMDWNVIFFAASVVALAATAVVYGVIQSRAYDRKWHHRVPGE